MKSTTISALSALLSTGALAVPMAGHAHDHAARHAGMHHLHKRDVVWITEFEIETVTVLRTIYADGLGPTDSPNSLSAVNTPAPITVTSYETETTPVVYSTSTQAPVPVTSSSSVYVAPAPAPATSSSPAYVAPAPQTSTQAPAPAPVTSTYAAPPPATSSSGGAAYSGNYAPGIVRSGDFTYFEVGLGACGITNTDADHIVAIPEDLFDAVGTYPNPNNNPLCGRTVTLFGSTGQNYTATVVDRCTGCVSLFSLDLSPSLFQLVEPTGNGRVHNAQWVWN